MEFPELLEEYWKDYYQKSKMNSGEDSQEYIHDRKVFYSGMAAYAEMFQIVLKLISEDKLSVRYLLTMASKISCNNIEKHMESLDNK
jgi:hypothetical protein